MSVEGCSPFFYVNPLNMKCLFNTFCVHPFATLAPQGMMEKFPTIPFDRELSTSSVCPPEWQGQLQMCFCDCERSLGPNSWFHLGIWVQVCVKQTLKVARPHDNRDLLCVNEQSVLFRLQRIYCVNFKYIYIYIRVCVCACGIYTLYYTWAYECRIGFVDGGWITL